MIQIFIKSRPGKKFKQMKNKVDVKICIGTYSYVMGGADLMNMENTLSPEWKDKVKFSGAISIKGCDEQKMKPPYASVNGNIIAEATTEKITKAITAVLNDK